MIYPVKGQDKRALVLCALILSSNVQYALYYNAAILDCTLDDLPSSNEINDHPVVDISGRYRYSQLRSQQVTEFNGLA